MASNRLQAIIVDDEERAISSLKEHLKLHPNIQCIGTYTDPQEAIDPIHTDKPDLLFLDIQMPRITGFDLAREIRSDHYNPSIIFVTAYEKYAIEAIRHAAFDYLLKPVHPSELSYALERLEKQSTHPDFPMKIERLIEKLSQVKQLKFNTCSGYIILDANEIIYCQACRNYCEIYLTDDRNEVLTVSLNNVGKLLPESSFFRISRSHIINLRFLTKVERRTHTAYLKFGNETIGLKISPRNSKLLEERFKE
ncbi:MAG: response regulator transcription factor [Bacteroidales bacterium]|nr:response regulator transcription factor [Bacteroidales bacterium]